MPSPYGPLRLDVYGDRPPRPPHSATLASLGHVAPRRTVPLGGLPAVRPLTAAEAAEVVELVEAARARWREGAFAAAEVQLIEVISARPYAAEAYGALAEMALAAGRSDEA